MNKPDIRFNGFNEEWTEKKLGDICEFSKGHGYSKKDLTSEGTPVYLYGQMYTNYKTSLVTSDIFVQPQSGSVYSTGKEVILPASGETPEDIARATAVLSEGIILGGDLNIVIPPKDLSQLFLALSISYEKNRNKLAEQAQGATITHLHNSDIAKLSIKYPESAEQKKLGALFSQIDSLIASTQKEHDKLVALKKCMLQKMFPKKGSLIPEIRFEGFSGDWVEKKLGDVTERITRKNTNLESDIPLTISAQYGLIDQRAFFNKRIASKDVSGYYVIYNGEFAYNKSYSDGYPFGAVKRLDKYDKGVLSTLYIIFSLDGSIDSTYLSYFYETSLWYKDVSEVAAEGARNHGLLNISADDFFTTKFVLPVEKKEQQKIGSYFQNLDNLISKQSAELEKLKNVKKTLLSKMFV